MIDWELWHSARELAHTGSYKLAAKRMAVNPTTIKRRKEALEQKVGRTLFLREGGNMVPTPIFLLALKKLESATQYLKDAETELQPGGDEFNWRRIVITSVPFVCDKLLSPAVHKMLAVRRLRIEFSGKDQNLELTGNKEADIALRLGPSRHKGIAALHAADIHYSTFSRIDGENVENLPWVTIDRSYSFLPEAKLPEEHSGESGIRFTATSTTAIQNMIVSGAAKGLLPNFIGDSDPNLERQHDHPTVKRQLWIMWREGSLEMPHYSSTINWILDVAGEALQLTEEAIAFQNAQRARQ